LRIPKEPTHLYLKTHFQLCLHFTHAILCPHAGHLPVISSSKEIWDKAALDAAGVLGWSTKGANGHGSWLPPP